MGLSAATGGLGAGGIGVVGIFGVNVAVTLNMNIIKIYMQ